MEDNRRITPRDYLELALRPVQGSGKDIGAKNEVLSRSCDCCYSEKIEKVAGELYELNFCFYCMQIIGKKCIWRDSLLTSM